MQAVFDFMWYLMQIVGLFTIIVFLLSLCIGLSKKMFKEDKS